MVNARPARISRGGSVSFWAKRRGANRRRFLIHCLGRVDSSRARPRPWEFFLVVSGIVFPRDATCLRRRILASVEQGCKARHGPHGLRSLFWSLRRPLSGPRLGSMSAFAPDRPPRVAVVIPARNEELSLRSVLRSIPPGSVEEVVVVDNGSTDGTASVARELGATVVEEPRRGYGSACLAGLEHLRRHPPEIVVF